MVTELWVGTRDGGVPSREVGHEARDKRASPVAQAQVGDVGQQATSYISLTPATSSITSEVSKPMGIRKVNASKFTRRVGRYEFCLSFYTRGYWWQLI